MSNEPLPYNPERQIPSVTKPALRMGAMIALMLIIYTLILYITGNANNRYVNWISYALMITGLWLGTKNYRDEQLGGTITFGQAYKMSFLTSFFSALIFAVFLYIYFKFLARDVMQEMKTISEQDLLDNPDISEDQAEMTMKIFNNYVFIPFSLAFTSILSFSFLGALLSLLVAGMVQRKTETPTV